eukprot:SAG25_NODE_113_length_14872_cov_23.149527_13_plen_73_part_00
MYGSRGVRVVLERYVSRSVFWQELAEYSSGNLAWAKKVAVGQRRAAIVVDWATLRRREGCGLYLSRCHSPRV